MSGRSKTAITALQRCALALLLLLFCAAPVPGDVGGCGQSPDQLDPAVFFATKRNIDCRKCKECGFSSLLCTEACDESAVIPADFPADCRPLVHDGEVCLRALHFAACDAYRDYIDDSAPTVPTECDFCPAGAR